MVSGCTGSEPSASYIVVPYAWWWHMQSPWAISQPGAKIDIIANRLTPAVGMPLRLVWTKRAAPPVATHIQCDFAGGPATNAIFEVFGNNWRRVLLGRIVTDAQGKTRYLWRLGAHAQAIRTAEQCVAA